MRMLPRRRTYVTSGITLAAVALLVFSGIEAGNGGRRKVLWVMLAVLMGFVAAAVSWYEQNRRERLRKDAERAAIEAAVELRVTMNDALSPVVRQLGRILTAKRQEREILREAGVAMILSCITGLLADKGVRACWYRLAEGSPHRLKLAQYAGRADEAVAEFDEDTAQGDAIFETIRHGRYLLSTHVDIDPPPGWSRPFDYGYRSFLAVPVVAGNHVSGVLTVDAENAGGLTGGEVPYVRLLGELLADILVAGTVDGFDAPGAGASTYRG